jgi:hypothetical protein
MPVTLRQILTQASYIKADPYTRQLHSYIKADPYTRQLH